MSDNRPRLCVVPRWGGTQSMEWYNWLCATDLVQDSFSAVLRPDVTDWEAPAIESWVATLDATCGRDTQMLSRTVFVAHSVGCQGVIRYLASLPAGLTAAGCLLVAGWWELDEPWDSIRPWVYTDETPASEIDLVRVRSACAHIRTLVSDNDQFTADWQKTKRDWEQRVNAQVQVVPGAKHFNAEDAPVVRDALADLLTAAR